VKILIESTNGFEKDLDKLSESDEAIAIQKLIIVSIFFWFRRVKTPIIIRCRSSRACADKFLFHHLLNLRLLGRKDKMKVWVLLFNADRDNQGIYTRLEGGKNIVLAFTQEDDAIRYAGLLEAQDFPSATTESIDLKELTEICEDTGLGLNIIQEDELAIPPVANEKTEWKKDGSSHLDRSNRSDRLDDFNLNNFDLDDFDNANLSAEALEIEIMRRKLEGLI